MRFLDRFKPKTIQLITMQIKIFEAGKSIEVGPQHKFHSITIKSHPSNVGMLFIGNIDVNVTNSIAIDVGEAISIDVGTNRYLSPFYITSNVSGSLVQIFGTGE